MTTTEVIFCDIWYLFRPIPTKRQSSKVCRQSSLLTVSKRSSDLPLTRNWSAYSHWLMCPSFTMWSSSCWWTKWTKYSLHRRLRGVRSTALLRVRTTKESRLMSCPLKAVPTSVMLWERLISSRPSRMSFSWSEEISSQTLTSKVLWRNISVSNLKIRIGSLSSPSYSWRSHSLIRSGALSRRSFWCLIMQPRRSWSTNLFRQAAKSRLGLMRSTSPWSSQQRLTIWGMIW